MAEKLLKKLFPHSFVGKALGDGVPKQVRVHPLLNPGLLGHVFHDLLDTPLRVVPSLPGSKDPAGLPVPSMQAQFVSEGRKNRYIPWLVPLRLAEADLQIPKRDVLNPDLPRTQGRELRSPEGSAS